MQRIKNIEFLRIVGCFAIVCLHLYRENLIMLFPDVSIYLKLGDIIRNGQKAVDLFFILSGIFFAYFLNIKYSLWNFLKKKFIRLYPVAIFIVLIAFLISRFGVIDFSLYSNLLILLNVCGTPMWENIDNLYMGVFWYVSAMLWVLGIYYYLIRNFDKKKVNFVIFLIIFFSYSFMISAKGGKINNPAKTIYFIFNIGFLRALGGIGIGYFIGEWWKSEKEKIKIFTVTLYQKLVITLIEFICLYFMINNLLFHKIKFKNDMIFIFDFIAVIVLFILKKGYISQILNDSFLGDISTNIAKYTYSVYMCHKLIFAILANSLWKYFSNEVYNHPILNIVYTLVFVFIFGVFTYHFVEEPCAKYLKQKLFKNKTSHPERISGGGVTS